MNFAVAAATFAVVVPAELPDKTFIASIVLSSRQRPLPVFFGVALGLIVQAGVAVAGGRLLDFAPHRVVDAIVAAAFFAGAAFLAFGPESHAEQHGEAIAERGGVESDLSEARITKTAMRVAATTFVVVVLSEFGDLTQIVIANLAAKTQDALSVFIGAMVAFIVTSALGVGLGQTITRRVSLSLVRRISAAVLCGLGIWSAVSAAS